MRYSGGKKFNKCDRKWLGILETILMYKAITNLPESERDSEACSQILMAYELTMRELEEYPEWLNFVESLRGTPTELPSIKYLYKALDDFVDIMESNRL